jgi:hypothetical protein
MSVAAYTNGGWNRHTTVTGASESGAKYLRGKVGGKVTSRLGRGEQRWSKGMIQEEVASVLDPENNIFTNAGKRIRKREKRERERLLG